LTERTTDPAVSPVSLGLDGVGVTVPPVDPATLVDAAEPVGAFIRLVAYMLDALVLVVAIYVVALILRAAIGPTLTFTDAAGVPRVQIDRLHSVINSVAATLVAGVYFAGSWLRFGATLGQRLIGARVERVDGTGRLRPAQAVARWLLLGTPLGLISTVLGPPSALSVILVLAIAFWFALLFVSTARSRRKRGLHDRITGTTVVRRRAASAPDGTVPSVPTAS
jgi:uncharacterized RDD family membrane protein YckC